MFLGHKTLAEAYALDGKLLEGEGGGMGIKQNQFPLFPFYRGEYSLMWFVVFDEKLYMIYDFHFASGSSQMVKISLLEIKPGCKLPICVNRMSDCRTEILQNVGSKMRLANCSWKTYKWLKNRTVTKRTIRRIMKVAPKG